MAKFSERWEITRPWQYVFPILGIIGLIFSGAVIAVSLVGRPDTSSTLSEILIFTGIAAIAGVICGSLCLWLFKKLKPRWQVDHRWELIAIFMVFAITGSTSARISQPLLTWIGLDPEYTSAWIFWPCRILIIFPLYQVLLVCIGWCFGQFGFFWAFEKKMLSRFGIHL